MKAYKSYTAAKAAANGLPILRVGSYKKELFIVGEVSTLTEIALLDATDHIVAHIGYGHLDRLGNGNWATEEKQHPRRLYAFDSNRLKAEMKAAAQKENAA